MDPKGQGRAMGPKGKCRDVDHKGMWILDDWEGYQGHECRWGRKGNRPVTVLRYRRAGKV